MTQCIRIPLIVTVAILCSIFISCAGKSRDNGTPAISREPIRTGKPKLEYDSAQLMMKSSDQMNELVKARMRKAANTQAAQVDDVDAEGITVEFETLAALKDALRIALSRPDLDGSRGPMFARIRRELLDLNSIDIVIRDLTQEAIDALKARRAAKVQATYVYVLENLMAELRPDLGTHPSYVRIVEMIRDADIEIDPDVRRQLMIRTMSKPVSPSDTAALLLPKSGSKKR